MSDNWNHFHTNKMLWDLQTAVHKDSDFYDMAKFRETKDSLNAIEVEALGDVTGKSMLHLQCHFGQDSLSWVNRGAEVTGVDFSEASIKLARELSVELGLPARFIEANVLELDAHLDGQFDLVFTSYGTVVWIPDLDQWAKIIHHFLKPGGIFYFVDHHPWLYTYDHDSKTLAYDYFFRSEPYEETNEGSYADRDAPIRSKEYSWSHSIEETMMPLVYAGLRLLEFKEFPYCPHDCFPNLFPTIDGNFVFGDSGINMPHLFSLKMQKPANG